MKPLRRTILLLCMITALILPARASAQSDYIRLHILADSDSLKDQIIKLCVRDDIREYTSALLKDCTDSDAAWQILQAHQNELLETAETAARRYGFKGCIRAELGISDFPDRTYGDDLIPAGEYRAVRITLGGGEGRNWWCVVYPSLCLPDTADTDKPVEFYSSIWRWAVRMWEAITR